MGKKRSRRDSRLPANLYANRVGRRIYYRYRDPRTGERHSFGSDRARAIRAAVRLNEKLLTGDELEQKVLGGLTVGDALERFDREYLRDRGYAHSTWDNYFRAVRDFGKYTKGRAVEAIDVRDVSEYLDDFPASAARERRKGLIHFFRYARGKGWIDHNPAEAALTRTEEVRRQRLTLEQFYAVRAHAKPHIQNAMDLSLKTLQARNEISRMKKQDYLNGKLRVVREKTRKASQVRAARGQEASAYIEIHADEELDEIIRRCYDDVASPYLIHQPATAHRGRVARQLAPASLTRAFKAARDKAAAEQPEVFRHEDGRLYAPEEMPTFHEIRSLGADLLRQKLLQRMGRDEAEERIQRLLTHTDSKMTRLYLEGHRIEWVKAGFD